MMLFDAKCLPFSAVNYLCQMYFISLHHDHFISTVADRMLARGTVTVGNSTWHLSGLHAAQQEQPDVRPKHVPLAVSRKAAAGVTSFSAPDDPAISGVIPTTVEVHGITRETELVVKGFFQSKSMSGGGEIQEMVLHEESQRALICFQKQEGNARGSSTSLILGQSVLYFEGFVFLSSSGILCKKPCFLKYSDAQEVLSRHMFTIGNQTVVVTPVVHSKSAAPALVPDPCTLEIRGFQKKTSTEHMCLFFEDFNRSGGGELVKADHTAESDVAYLTFADPEGGCCHCHP